MSKQCVHVRVVCVYEFLYMRVHSVFACIRFCMYVHVYVHGVYVFTGCSYFRYRRQDMVEENQGFFSYILFNVWPFCAWVRTVEEGAAAQVSAAVDPTYGAPERGSVYISDDKAVYKPQKGAKSDRPEVMKRVWDMSEKAIKDLGFSLTLEDEKSKI